MIVYKKTVICTLALIILCFSINIQKSEANPKPTCLYCKRADQTATLLVSYSYCAASDTCLEDKWMYIYRPCSSTWVLGKNINLVSTCTPTSTSCHSFISSTQQAGQQVNYTETLASGEYCDILVDATNFIARVILDDALTLGVEMDYDIGDVYNVPKG